MTSRVGQQLGNYRLIRFLGQGGFADVYLGSHLHLNTLAAVKILHALFSHKDEASFLAEARIIARLGHPHIVRVLDYGVQGTTPFLVMDYAPNGTLREKHPKGTPLPLSTIISYVTQIADALQFAHVQGLIHRDVKPENMLLGRSNEVLLSDFGLALIAQSSRSQDVQQVAGTITYMAPEQLQGKPRLASDQYALGIVVYEWLCGSPPFVGSFPEVASRHVLTPPPPLHEKISTLSPELEQVVMTALAKEPRQRFPSVQAFATALEHAYEASQLLSLPASLGQSSSTTHPFNPLAAQSPSLLKPPMSSPEIILSPSQELHYSAASRETHVLSPLFRKKKSAKGSPTPFRERYKIQKLSRTLRGKVAILVGVVLLVLITSVGLLSPALVRLIFPGSSHLLGTMPPTLTISPKYCGGQLPVHICVQTPSEILSAYYPYYVATQSKLFIIHYSSSSPITLEMSVSIKGFSQVETHTVTATANVQSIGFMPVVIHQALSQLTADENALLEVRVTDTVGHEYYTNDSQLLLRSRWLMQWIAANRLKIAAWVTPDDPDVMALVSKAAARLQSEPSAPPAMIGYGSDINIENVPVNKIATPRAVRDQVDAIFDTMRLDYHMKYSQASVPYTGPGDNSVGLQFIKLPSEVVHQQSGTSLELTALLASAVEHIGLHAEIVIILGHAFLGVAVTPNDSQFEYWDAVQVNSNIAGDSANLWADNEYRQNAKQIVDTIVISDARKQGVDPML